MQDKSLALIGELELQKMQDLPAWARVTENMYPNKNYEMVLLDFEFKKEADTTTCQYTGIDIEKVSDESDWRKFAYKKGTSKGGDYTFTTKYGDKKLDQMIDALFPRLIDFKGTDASEDVAYFRILLIEIKEKREFIRSALKDSIGQKDPIKEPFGISIRLKINGELRYLADFKLIQDFISNAAQVSLSEKYGEKSIASNQICSVTQKIESTVFGFAAPYKYSTVDKKGFISGFFSQKNNWKNYPISETAAYQLEAGKTFVSQNLCAYFYGKKYMMIPRTILSSDLSTLQKIINRLTSFVYEASSKKMKANEEYIEKMIAAEENYFNLDLIFFEEDPKTESIGLKMVIEEILPSRFRKIFKEVPAVVNDQPIFENAITIKKEKQNLCFNFGIVLQFYSDSFLDMMSKIYLGQKLSEKSIYERIMLVIRENYNKAQTSENFVEPSLWSILKGIMLIQYFQQLNMISYQTNYKFMEQASENQSEKKKSFDTEKYMSFIQSNSSFLDADIKVGVFSVGVFVRLLLAMQSNSLGGTPFEKKLKGYNLNAEVVKNVYLEAMQKMAQYTDMYVYNTYADLRSIINTYFTVKVNDLKQMTNGEISFYFVAGLEFGNKFKTEKETEK